MDSLETILRTRGFQNNDKDDVFVADSPKNEFAPLNRPFSCYPHSESPMVLLKNTNLLPAKSRYDLSMEAKKEIFKTYIVGYTYVDANYNTYKITATFPTAIQYIMNGHIGKYKDTKIMVGHINWLEKMGYNFGYKMSQSEKDLIGS